MNAGMRECRLLRRELGRVWRMIDAIMGAWTEQASFLCNEIRRLGGDLAAARRRCKELEAELKDTKRWLAMYENYNNSDRGTVTAKKRKEHRRKLAEAEGAGSSSSNSNNNKAGAETVPQAPRRRGGQSGSPGVSFTQKPDRNGTGPTGAPAAGGPTSYRSRRSTR